MKILSLHKRLQHCENPVVIGYKKTPDGFKLSIRGNARLYVDWPIPHKLSPLAELVSVSTNILGSNRAINLSLGW